VDQGESGIILIAWVVTVAVILLLATGFAGSAEAVFSESWLAWGLLLSPAIPLFLWLRSRPWIGG
jgi:hypothetical protein